MKKDPQNISLAIASMGEVSVPFVIRTKKRLLIAVERVVTLHRIFTDKHSAPIEPILLLSPKTEPKEERRIAEKSKTKPKRLKTKKKSARP